MGIKIEDKFLALKPDDTRRPEKIRAITPSAKKIYVLKERFDCGHWKHVSDCFHQVEGSFIVTEPTAGRRYFTLEPRKVIERLREIGVW